MAVTLEQSFVAVIYFWLLNICHQQVNHHIDWYEQKIPNIPIFRFNYWIDTLFLNFQISTGG